MRIYESIGIVGSARHSSYTGNPDKLPGQNGLGVGVKLANKERAMSKGSTTPTMSKGTHTLCDALVTVSTGMVKDTVHKQNQVSKLLNQYAGSKVELVPTPLEKAGLHRGADKTLHEHHGATEMLLMVDKGKGSDLDHEAVKDRFAELKKIILAEAEVSGRDGLVLKAKKSAEARKNLSRYTSVNYWCRWFLKTNWPEMYKVEASPSKLGWPTGTASELDGSSGSDLVKSLVAHWGLELDNKKHKAEATKAIRAHLEIKALIAIEKAFRV